MAYNNLEKAYSRVPREILENTLQKKEGYVARIC